MLLRAVAIAFLVSGALADLTSPAFAIVLSAAVYALR